MSANTSFVSANSNNQNNKPNKRLVALIHQLLVQEAIEMGIITFEEGSGYPNQCDTFNHFSCILHDKQFKCKSNAHIVSHLCTRHHYLNTINYLMLSHVSIPNLVQY